MVQPILNFYHQKMHNWYLIIYQNKGRKILNRFNTGDTKNGMLRPGGPLLCTYVLTMLTSHLHIISIILNENNDFVYDTILNA